MEPELPKDFKEFLSLLRSHGVRHLLIDRYAVGYHGSQRATGGVDMPFLDGRRIYHGD